jgi:hypothetical protein
VKSVVAGKSPFAGLWQAPETSSKLSHCFHTAEVAGSNPASPTTKYLQIVGKFEPPIFEWGLFTATVLQRGRRAGRDVVQRYLEVGPIGELGVEEYAARLGHGLRDAWLWYGW